MAERQARILGPDGQPLQRQRTLPGQRRMRALNGGGDNYMGPPYDAADSTGQHMAAWQPYLPSPDGEINFYRDRIVARVRDMVRNDGWASGSVTRILDNVIGVGLRPIAKPDHRYLAAYSGNKGFDAAWAKDFARALDACWRSWAITDMGRWCDVSRNSTFGQILALAFRHKLVDGDALAVLMWLPERLGVGRARYCTAIQLIDPDRLSNPMRAFDSMTMRGGVELDRFGATIAYHIRKAHEGDWFTAVDQLTWERVLRDEEDGRPKVVHDYDSTRAGQHRGGAGIFAPVLQKLKMLVKYDNVELDSAIINSIFGAYIESPFDRQLVQEAVDDGESLPFYQQSRAEFHADSAIMLGNARIPIMFPGESINAVSATRPVSNFQSFENAVLRNVASGLGLSAQQVSNDWSDVNYSSARGALLEAWKTLDRRRQEFADSFASPLRAAWLEEAMVVDDLPMPSGYVPEFRECRGAYARCTWMGPGRGWVDPVAEKQGAVLGMDAALSTLQDECAAQGLDFEEVLEQRKYEIGLFEEYGIPMPAWVGVPIGAAAPAGTTAPKQPGDPANTVSKPPTTPKPT